VNPRRKAEPNVHERRSILQGMIDLRGQDSRNDKEERRKRECTKQQEW
jgi:hypothetical protein